MKDYQIKTSKNKETQALDIIMEGHLNVSNIYEIHKEFHKTVKNSKKINVEITNADDADITIIQLIEAFKQTCKIAEIEFNIKYTLSNETSELFDRAGLKNTIN